MTEQDIINNALKLAVQASKNSYNKKQIGVHDLYEDSVEMMNDILVHAKKKFPEKLFKSSSPNIEDNEFKYIKDNYTQATLPVFVDYISTICRPFGDGNWSITYAEDSKEYSISDNTFKKYVEGDLPIYGSLENFIKHVLPTIKTIDANGFLAVRPKELDVVEDSEGNFVLDSSKLVEPTVLYFKSCDVVNYEHGSWYLFKSFESSILNSGKEGDVYELYTKEGVYFVKQIGDRSEYKFNVEKFFEVNLPVIQLKGIPILDEDELLWQSPFYYCVDNLNLVVINTNWLQASVKKCMYPHTVMLGNPCEFKDAGGYKCSSGIIINETGVERVCPSCNGSGLKSRLSPLGTLLIKPSNKFEEGETGNTQPPLQFISPSVESLDFVIKKIDIDEQRARTILKLRTKNSNTQTQNEKTATEVADDAKGMTAFIKPISDQIFDIYDFCLKQIGAQRYGSSFNAPQLVYPKTFDFKNAEDYLKDISDALKNNLPPTFIQTILMNYISAFYGDNNKTVDIFKLILKADRLFGLSQDEINIKMAKGTISKWEDILHSSAIYFINQFILENDNFLNLDVNEQIAKLQDAAKTEASTIAGELVTSIIGQ